jgi:uncharacterized membrane protein YeaQ/YmgE (transglycosylase-associated protein family)
MLELIIALISGAVGGNLAAKLFKSIDMGTLINSIAGIVGGGIGGQIVAALLGGAGMPVEGAAADPAAGLDIGAIIGQIVGGGVGGGILLAIVKLLFGGMRKT